MHGAEAHGRGERTGKRVRREGPLQVTGVTRRGPSRMVREGGVEPPRPFGHWNLNPARLPIPPPAHGCCLRYPAPSSDSSVRVLCVRLPTSRTLARCGGSLHTRLRWPAPHGPHSGRRGHRPIARARPAPITRPSRHRPATATCRNPASGLHRPADRPLRDRPPHRRSRTAHHAPRTTHEAPAAPPDGPGPLGLSRLLPASPRRPLQRPLRRPPPRPPRPAAAAPEPGSWRRPPRGTPPVAGH